MTKHEYTITLTPLGEKLDESRRDKVINLGGKMYYVEGEGELPSEGFVGQALRSIKSSLESTMAYQQGETGTHTVKISIISE